MSQVLINLIRNAGQAARGHAEAPHVWLASRAPARKGPRSRSPTTAPACPRGCRQDIFLPFFTTKAEGTGVGLSLARQVVLAHKGSISVGDRTGGGALFRIVL